MPSGAVTCRYMPLHTVTYRCRVALVEAFAVCFTHEAWGCYASMLDDSVLADRTGAVVVTHAAGLPETSGDV